MKKMRESDRHEADYSHNKTRMLWIEFQISMSSLARAEEPKKNEIPEIDKSAIVFAFHSYLQPRRIWIHVGISIWNRATFAFFTVVHHMSIKYGSKIFIIAIYTSVRCLFSIYSLVTIGKINILHWICAKCCYSLKTNNAPTERR